MTATASPTGPSLWTLLSRSVQLWVGMFLLLVGIVLGSVGLQQVLQEHAYRAQGVTVNATVIEKSILRAKRGENSRTRYLIAYRFTSAQREAVNGSTEVPVEEWERLETGRPFAVTYLPGVADSSRGPADEKWIVAVVFLAIGGVFTLVGGGLTFVDARAGLRAVHISHHGMATQGTVVHAGPTRTAINRVPQWRIDYRYRDHLGNTHEAASHLLSPQDGAAWKAGDQGTVRFDPERTQISVWMGAT